ncbi:replication initiation protein RepC [Roseibium salinum]|nr:replication initiation protein RepC [Roseibium salinum]
MASSAGMPPPRSWRWSPKKALRDPDRINSPGGYFRAMVDRAVEGKLALAKSLFGLAAG